MATVQPRLLVYSCAAGRSEEIDLTQEKTGIPPWGDGKSIVMLVFVEALSKSWQPGRKEDPESQALTGWEKHLRISQSLWYKRDTCTNRPDGDGVAPYRGTVWARHVTQM